MVDIDDLLARLEAEDCDRGRYDREAAAVIRELMAPATPEPAGDLVEQIRQILLAHIHIGNNGFVDLVQGIPEASRAIAAMPDHAALADMLASQRDKLDQELTDAFKMLSIRDDELTTLRLSNDLLEQFRKSDLEELATLRTQLAASIADVARLRELTEALSKADGLCTFNRGDHRTIEFAFDEHEDGHKAFELLSDALATIKDAQP